MNYIPRTLVTILAAAACANTAVAAEMTFLDLRVGAGLLSNEFKGESSTTVTNNSSNISTNSNSGNDSRNSDQNYRGQIELVYGYLGHAGGVIVGATLATNHAEFDNGEYDATVTTPVLDVMVGYGLAVTPIWHFEIAPFVGYGRSYYSVNNATSSSTSKDSAPYVEYGGRLGTYVTFPSGLQLGVEVPYLVGRYNPDYNHDDGTDIYSVSDERRNEGFGVLVSVGARF